MALACNRNAAKLSKVAAMKVEPCSVRLQGHALESVKAYVLAKRISLRPLTWGLPSSLHPLSLFFLISSMCRSSGSCATCVKAQIPVCIVYYSDYTGSFSGEIITTYPGLAVRFKRQPRTWGLG